MARTRPVEGAAPGRMPWPSPSRLTNAPRSTRALERSWPNIPMSAPSSGAASARDPSAEALVYLRTALDPDARRDDSAASFSGCSTPPTRWLRRNGIGPGDVVSRARAQLHGDVDHLLGGDEFGRRSAAQPAVHPRGDRRAGQRRQGQNPVRRRPLARPAGSLRRPRACSVSRRASSASSCCRWTAASRSTTRRSSPTDERDPLDVADPDRIVALLPTGGTTGAPKVVPLSNRNVVSSAIGSMLAIDVRPERSRPDRAADVSCRRRLLLAACRRSARARRWSFRPPAACAIPTSSPNFWRIVEAQRITIGALVPTALGAVAAVPLGGADISRLRLLRHRRLRSARRRSSGASSSVWPGDCVRQLYGMTEFAGAITQTPHDREQQPGSVGMPVALAEVAVLAGGQIHRGPSPTGEILARGPQMFRRLFRPAPGRRDVPRGLAAQRRSRPDRRGRRGLCHRPRQGPHHPRRPQYRSGRYRGCRAALSRRRPRRGGRAARPLRRRDAGPVRVRPRRARRSTPARWPTSCRPA